MRVLLTGATGFVGGAVARALLARGHILRVLARQRDKARPLERFGAEIIVGELRDPAALAEAAEKTDAVVHAAGITAEPLPGDFTQVNVEGTRNVLEAASGAGTVQRLLYISSMSACGPAPAGGRLSEETPCHPLSAYGRSMLNGERLVRAFGERLPVTLVRLPVVYGPGDKKLVPLYRLARLGFLPALKTHSQHLSLLYVDDLGCGVAEALESPQAAGETFFLAHPETVSAPELMQTIGFAAGTEVTVVTVPRAAAFGAAFIAEGLGRLIRLPSPLNTDALTDLWGEDWSCSAARARDILGFEAQVGYREGLRRAAPWYLGQPLEGRR
jgi:nucleoside-diphosphate-sugar epimerase